MLNSYSKAYNNLNISTTSGTLVKSHPKSITLTYMYDSDLCKLLHDRNPSFYYDGKYGIIKGDCVVIQTMIVGEKLFMSEVVKLSDYLENNAE